MIVLNWNFINANIINKSVLIAAYCEVLKNKLTFF
jgi:hypothetical protein